MKSVRLLLFLTALLWGPSAVKAQANWPDADSIVGVSVLVFEHANAIKPNATQTGITPFPSAIDLPQVSKLQLNDFIQDRKESRARSAEANLLDAPTLPWSMQNWLGFLHAGVLSQLDQPLIGPPLPPKPATPLLNAPMLMRESAQLPENLSRAVSRIGASEAHSLLRAMHWYQVLDRRTNGPKIYVTDRPTKSAAPWDASIEWAKGFSNQPPYADQLAGYVELTQDQFTRAQVKLCLHETHQQSWGPLRPSHLAPTGYQVTCLEVNRAIEPNQWNYFDSEALGVLLQVSTR